jgi:hypothetical protein
MIKESELDAIYKRWGNTQVGPWKAFIEGRDHTCGSNFIMTGQGENRGEDIYLYGATIADYDFIANAKQDIPELLNEIKRLRKLSNGR